MELPFFSQLRESRTVLLAGAGGGFDIYAGMPLLRWLEGMGESTESYFELDLAIERFRNTLPSLRPWSSIPH